MGKYKRWALSGCIKTKYRLKVQGSKVQRLGV